MGTEFRLKRRGPHTTKFDWKGSGRCTTLHNEMCRTRSCRAMNIKHQADYLYVVKDTNKVVKHLENWDAEPSRVLKSLLKPATRPPQNDWETFFLALSGGDAKTMWFTSSKYVTIGWLPIVLVSLGTKAATGEGLQVGE